ncbi:hypothetical protein PMAYCL1PPCAC_11334, partial [Pristionchus mayeri]
YDPRKEEFKSKMCGKFLSCRPALIHHMQTHLDENDPKNAEILRPFKCTQCGKGFRQSQNLKHHMNMHAEILICFFPDDSDPRKVKHKCDICNAILRNSSDLNRHKQTHLTDNDPRKPKHACNVCGKTFSESKNCYRHQLTHLADNDPRKPKHACNVCGKTFSESKNRYRHQQTKKKIVFECDLCDKKYRRKESLNAHKISHNESENKTSKKEFACKICGKRLKSQEYLLRHERSHLG